MRLRCLMAAWAAAFTLAGCGSPIAPTPLDYSGSWSGTAELGPCSPPGCGSGVYKAHPGPVHPVRLTLTQANGALAGTVELGVVYDPPPGASFASFEQSFGGPTTVSGTVDAYGFTLRAQQSSTTADGFCGRNVIRVDVAFSVTGLDERGGLVGAFSFTRTRNEISCYFSDYTIAGRLVNVIRAGS